MLLSKTCSYGIRAAIYIAVQKDQQYVPIKEISETLKISFHFLTKILQILTKKGIIESIKGPGGGVGLRIDPSEISILDIIYAIAYIVVLWRKDTYFYRVDSHKYFYDESREHYL